MTDDRLEIDAARARRLVAAQFPRWRDRPVRPLVPGGWDNRSFRLGDDLKLRFPAAARYAAQPGKEHAWLPRLAPALPVAIPEPVALGVAGEGYPFPWAVQRWIDGTPARAGRPADPAGVAAFLRALWRIPAAGGPAAGAHSFHRGGSLAVCDGAVRACLAALAGRLDTAAAAAVWEAALAAPRQEAPVWVHGDVAPGNLLLDGGRLVAVIDFGTCATGDPACDLVAAWTLYEGEARATFRDGVAADAGTRARARGWALWKALLVLACRARANPLERPPASVVACLLAEAAAAPVPCTA